MDMGIDWRQHSPAQLEVGPVLNVDDAVTNKVTALYSRAEPRDYLDVAAIRQSGKYINQQLLDFARQSDSGFDTEMFAHQLTRIAYIPYRAIKEYGTSESDYNALQIRFTQWAAQIHTGTL